MTRTASSTGARRARGAVCAGLALATTLGSLPATAFADESSGATTPPANEYANSSFSAQTTARSYGDTKLYVIARQDDLTIAEGGVSDQLKVSVPVAIHYVADNDGNLSGPSDDTVKFVNHTKLGAVHVSKIAVEGKGGAKIVEETENMAADTLALNVTPVQGTSNEAGSTFTHAEANTGANDQLGKYATKSTTQGIDPINRNDWNIAANNGALALNNLTGKIGGFNALNPSYDTYAGVIHWTVRAGTRAQADERDATLTIHYHANGGSFKNLTPIDDQHVPVLDVTKYPEIVASESGMKAALDNGSTLAAPTVPDGSKTYTFKGWSLRANGEGDDVIASGRIEDLGEASDLAGKTIELYAIYGE